MMLFISHSLEVPANCVKGLGYYCRADRGSGGGLGFCIGTDTARPSSEVSRAVEYGRSYIVVSIIFLIQHRTENCNVHLQFSFFVLDWCTVLYLYHFNHIPHTILAYRIQFFYLPEN
jgi:hypothetical protein